MELRPDATLHMRCRTVCEPDREREKSLCRHLWKKKQQQPLIPNPESGGKWEFRNLWFCFCAGNFMASDTRSVESQVSVCLGLFARLFFMIPLGTSAHQLRMAAGVWWGGVGGGAGVDGVGLSPP